MSWAGDVAKMLSRLVFNPVTKQETYTVSTAGHRTWQEITDYYKALIGLAYIPVDTKTYLSIFGDENIHPGYQLRYDRLFNRVVDNSKILAATGFVQSDFLTLRQGLERELSALPRDTRWSETPINAKMDEILNAYGK